MDQKNQEDTNPVGLERFHKITIGTGIACMGLMVWRYLTLYSQTDSGRYLAYAVVAMVLMVGTAAYLWRFSKKGI